MTDKHSAPAYSMGISKSSNKSPTQSFPGPGSYEAVSSINAKISNSVYFETKPEKAQNLALDNIPISFLALELIIHHK